NPFRRLFTMLALTLLVVTTLGGCAAEPDNNIEFLTRNSSVRLMDWHVSGLWVINCPVAWIRVDNYNDTPIKEITFQYNTYDTNGKPLNQGTYTIEGSVAPHSSKNFIELYLGLVDLYSERLSVKVISVHGGKGGDH